MFKSIYSKSLGLVLVCAICLCSTGCANFGSYMSLALQFALNGLQIYAISTQTVVNPNTIKLLTDKEANIVTLEQGFVKGKTPVEDVQNAVADFQNNITTTFNLLAIKNPKTQSMIAGIVGLINSNITLAETFYQTNQGTMKSSTRTIMRTVTVGNYPNSKIPSTGELKHRYNQIVSVQTGDVGVDNYNHHSTF